MKVRVQLTEPAQEEHLEALRFYRADSLQIAKSFNREFKREIALLRERPWIGSPHIEGRRRKVFAHFPYSFVYVLQDSLLTIHAVAHHSRDPEYWLDRVRQRHDR